MDRRSFALGLGACALAGAPAMAQTIDMCGVRFPSGQVGCRAGMTFGRALEVRAFQAQSVWCWAAALEMIFRAHGYLVPQDQFVLAVYGRIVNLPAFSGYTMTNQLNRNWTDTQGKRFRVQITGLYDHDAGQANLSNAQIVEALKTGRPLLICNNSHAMVLGIVDYFPGPPVQIHAAGVIDPWPLRDMSEGGTRGLQVPELVPMRFGGQLRYLALPMFTTL